MSRVGLQGALALKPREEEELQREIEKEQPEREEEPITEAAKDVEIFLVPGTWYIYRYL